MTQAITFANAIQVRLYFEIFQNLINHTANFRCAILLGTQKNTIIIKKIKQNRAGMEEEKKLEIIQEYDNSSSNIAQDPNTVIFGDHVTTPVVYDGKTKLEQNLVEDMKNLFLSNDLPSQITQQKDSNAEEEKKNNDDVSFQELVEAA